MAGPSGGSWARSASRMATRRPASSRSSRSRAASGSRASTSPAACRRTSASAAVFATGHRRGAGQDPREGLGRPRVGPAACRLHRAQGHRLVFVPDEVEQGGEGGVVLDPVEHLDRGQPGRPARGGENGAQRLDDAGPEEGQARDGGVALGRAPRGEPAQQVLYARGAGWYDRHDEGSSLLFSPARRPRARPGGRGRRVARRRPAHPALRQGAPGRGDGERRGPRHGPHVPAVAATRPGHDLRLRDRPTSTASG